MKLEELYQIIIEEGVRADPRGKKVIEEFITQKRKECEKLEPKEKELFDEDSLFNPFADTRILYGDKKAEIKSVIVGIDIGGSEVLLVDTLRQRGKRIDLIISHHPQGRAYANFYEVMDLQINVFYQKGVSISVAENLLGERKAEVARRVGAANHQRVVDIARWLDINFMCMHTPADNLAYRYIEQLMEKERPDTLGRVIDLLLAIPEYKEAAKNNNPPTIFIGNKKSKVSKVHIEFTGGTEGPKDIYTRLSNSGIDTIIAMHQSEEHFKKCKEVNMNVVVASHIASDNLGVNLILDRLIEKDSGLEVNEFSGFRRFNHSKEDRDVLKRDDSSRIY